MGDILFTALILACLLSMLAMGAVAWVSTRFRRGRGSRAATGRPAITEGAGLASGSGCVAADFENGSSARCPGSDGHRQIGASIGAANVSLLPRHGCRSVTGSDRAPADARCSSKTGALDVAAHPPAHLRNAGVAWSLFDAPSPGFPNGQALRDSPEGAASTTTTSVPERRPWFG
jgi:hypothetical protein